VSVGISYKGECWDLVGDFDAYAEQRSSDGWFCRLCAEQGKQELFPSCDALFVAHGLEPFLSWANGSFTPETWVCAFRSRGATWIELKQAKDVEAQRTSEHFIDAFPIVVSKKGN